MPIGKITPFVLVRACSLNVGARTPFWCMQIIQAVLQHDNVRHERIDGSVTKTQSRQDIVDRFNSDASISVCLLTTGVGAYGLTLIGADRVIIMDPSWNPGVIRSECIF